MITINLIPEEEKRELRVFDIYLMIRNIIYIILIGVIFIAFILLVTKFYLQNYFNRIVSQTYITAGLSQFSSNEIKKFNEEFEIVKEVQDNFVAWSNLFLNLGKMVNEGITIAKLDINKKNLEIKIMGTARNRDDLIKFKDNLDLSGYFNAFEIPLSTLLQRENINFNFTLKLVNLDIADTR
jgi:hypothetical protein